MVSRLLASRIAPVRIGMLVAAEAPNFRRKQLRSAESFTSCGLANVISKESSVL